MRVKMLTTVPASPDGLAVQLYKKGEEYDVPKPLGTMFVAEDWAEALKAAPAENKQAKGPGSNK